MLPCCIAQAYARPTGDLCPWYDDLRDQRSRKGALPTLSQPQVSHEPCQDIFQCDLTNIRILILQIFDRSAWCSGNQPPQQLIEPSQKYTTTHTTVTELFCLCRRICIASGRKMTFGRTTHPSAAQEVAQPVDSPLLLGWVGQKIGLLTCFLAIVCAAQHVPILCERVNWQAQKLHLTSLHMLF